MYIFLGYSFGRDNLQIRKEGSKIKLSLDCLQCLLKQAFGLAGKHINDDRDRLSFVIGVMREISGSTDESTIAPLVAGKIHRVFREFVNNSDPYREDKDFYNQRMLSLEGDFESLIANAENKLSTAVKLAAAGNVIDFGAIPDLESSKVFKVIRETVKKKFPGSVLEQLLNDFKQAKTLLYLGDNAGEIVMDKLLIKEINKRYPELKIYFATRGRPVINDVTERDAIGVGINEYAHVINNGTDIPGTVLSACSAKFLEVFDQADVIVSKGQGNFESLFEAAKKIYFIFLCKCAYFEKKLGIGKHEIVLYCNK